MTDRAKYPGQAPLSYYGNGGFRFAEVSHQGSLLLLPSGIYAWDVADFSNVGVEDFEQVFLETSHIDFLLLGCGQQQLIPDADIRHAFDGHDIGLEYMNTGAAVRTYNVLLAEKRKVAAALIAVDTP